MIQLLQGDCVEKMKELPDNSVDSIATDPPYELGFMGKSWDNTGIANNKDMWADCLRVLKPGGHLLAFSGTRTYHRMACAIEDAGFEVRDMIEWVYASGFPKSLNIGKAVDKLQGNERKTLGTKYELLGVGSKPGTVGDKHEGYQRPWNADPTAEAYMVTKGTSEYEGWGTALKPAHEPICMARKPLSEKTVAENCLKWGTGGINIDESRVEHNEPEKLTNRTPRTEENVFSDDNCGFKKETNHIASASQLGRFPANLIHDNSEEVRECFPESKSTAGVRHNGNTKSLLEKGFEGEPKDIYSGHNDSGNASRFFKSIIYTAKASKSERNKGCEGLETKQTQGGGGGIGDYQDDVNSMSGKYGSEKAPAKNNHPTVKPIALMEYLIKMITPKGGTVLDPFMGSGSTGCAAKINGFKFIGIEREPEYIEIAKRRIEAAKPANQRRLF